MRATRSPGQKLVPVPVSEAFLRDLDDGLRLAGYGNRSQFIRDAIHEKLQRMGHDIPRGLAQAPERLGKGGPRKKTIAAKKKVAKRKTAARKR